VGRHFGCWWVDCWRGLREEGERKGREGWKARMRGEGDFIVLEKQWEVDC
jgi:hypothetical protein